ncbi:uncharacterized protein LOC133731089 [Rosa rugosa]|uniref:uncharacterized protein LOC133731089 n=1 Tax=Rosa rugosa TaxID=74645 RepID=UPI002B407171|nr:uncharacterized protein LOC133731089 [Rosa rugosa]
MNLCMNCAEGTTFLSSKEASDEAHTGTYIFKYVDKCIKDVGPQNVVQVVKDNASNNMAAGDLMKLKRPNIFWTSCATHTLNLMLQGIGNQPRFKWVIEKAKSFTIYIYAHHKTLALMKKFTKKRDIMRPGVTRFATAFLTLQSLMEKKNELRAMITNNEWNASKHAKSVKGKAAVNIALSASFWNGVSICLKVFGPLVKVLRLVDRDRKPSMSFVYGELLRAKEEIKMAFKDQEAHYCPILDIVDGKARGRLDSPLHLAGYLLNPYYTYANPSIENDNVVMDGFFTCVEVFFPDDIQTQSLVTNVELHKYLKKEGGFGRTLAKNPDHQQEEKNVDVLLASEATMAQGWIVDGGDEDVDFDLTSEVVGEGSRLGVDSSLEPRRSCRIQEIRELHEENFVSDEEEEDEMDFEFESDEEGVLEGYGEEEFED